MCSRTTAPLTAPTAIAPNHRPPVPMWSHWALKKPTKQTKKKIPQLQHSEEKTFFFWSHRTQNFLPHFLHIYASKEWKENKREIKMGNTGNNLYRWLVRGISFKCFCKWRHLLNRWIFKVNRTESQHRFPQWLHRRWDQTAKHETIFPLFQSWHKPQNKLNFPKIWTEF